MMSNYPPLPGPPPDDDDEPVKQLGRVFQLPHWF